MPSYKLSYFDVKGRGQIPRMMFNMANQKFEDERVSFADWPKMKPTTPFGFMPVLTVDGSYVICDAAAVNRFIAREFGFMGANNREAGVIDMMIGSCLDTMKPILSIASEKDEEKKAKLVTEFKTKDGPKFLKFVEKKLGGNDWLVGNKPSLGDIAIFDIGSLLTDNLDKDALKKCPKVEAHYKRVQMIPNLQGYFEMVAKNGK